MKKHRLHRLAKISQTLKTSNSPLPKEIVDEFGLSKFEETNCAEFIAYILKGFINAPTGLQNQILMLGGNPNPFDDILNDFEGC